MSLVAWGKRFWAGALGSSGSRALVTVEAHAATLRESARAEIARLMPQLGAADTEYQETWAAVRAQNAANVEAYERQLAEWRAARAAGDTRRPRPRRPAPRMTAVQDETLRLAHDTIQALRVALEEERNKLAYATHMECQLAHVRTNAILAAMGPAVRVLAGATEGVAPKLSATVAQLMRLVETNTAANTERQRFVRVAAEATRARTRAQRRERGDWMLAELYGADSDDDDDDAGDASGDEGEAEDAARAPAATSAQAGAPPAGDDSQSVGGGGG